MVTHPSSNRAQSCLTSVIGPQMIPPCQRAHQYNFEHVTNSPHHHKGNGLAEKYVDIIKNWLQKAIDSKEDSYKSMLVYRRTTSYCLEWSYKQMYTDLPISNLRRSIIHGNDNTNISLRNQRKSDPKVQIRQPAPLLKGTQVMVWDTNTKTWFPATIRSPHSEPNSYGVVAKTGVTYKRSWHHLKPYLPRLPGLTENDTGTEHDQNDQTQLQEGENQSHIVNEAWPLLTRKPVHRYIGEM